MGTRDYGPTIAVTWKFIRADTLVPSFSASGFMVCIKLKHVVLVYLIFFKKPVKSFSHFENMTTIPENTLIGKCIDKAPKNWQAVPQSKIYF